MWRSKALRFPPDYNPVDTIFKHILAEVFIKKGRKLINSKWKHLNLMKKNKTKSFILNLKMVTLKLWNCDFRNRKLQLFYSKI